jgi:ubiquinone/menaquinone biosynthesis C-methylase UbiE
MRSKSGSDKECGEILRVFQSRQETRAYYDKISRVYDLLAERSEEPMRAAGLQVLGAKAGEKVLEIGFGTGHSLVALASAVQPEGTVYGVDLSEGMLKASRETLSRKQAPARVELICADALRLPFPPGTMDAVFMSFTLELFDTPEIPEVLAECGRALCPDGRMAIVSLSKEGPMTALLHAYEWTHRHFPNFLDCRPIYVERALKEAGLQILSAEIRKMWLPVEIVLAKMPSP